MNRAEQVLLITNKLGLHARAATQLAKLASAFSATIHITKDGKEVSADSVLGLMMLEASQHKEVKVICEGSDANEALAAVAMLFSERFNESE